MTKTPKNPPIITKHSNMPKDSPARIHPNKEVKNTAVIWMLTLTETGMNWIENATPKKEPSP